MRILLIAIVVSFGVSSLVQAQPPRRGPRGERPNREEMHKKILEKFDTNKNGKIDDEEKAAIREAFAKRRAAAGGEQARDKKDGDKKDCPAGKKGCDAAKKGCPAAKKGCGDDKKDCPAGKKGPGHSDAKRGHHHKGHQGHHGRGGHGRGDGDKGHHKDHGKRGHDRD